MFYPLKYIMKNIRHVLCVILLLTLKWLIYDMFFMSVSKEKILNFEFWIFGSKPIKLAPVKRHPFKSSRKLYIRYLASSRRHNSISHITHYLLGIQMKEKNKKDEKEGRKHIEYILYLFWLCTCEFLGIFLAANCTSGQQG